MGIKCQKNKIIHIVADALNTIGLIARLNENASGFLEKINIKEGVLEYQETATPSNLLHEAGHLACLPPKLRVIVNNDISDIEDIVQKEMKDRFKETGNLDDPYIRAMMQCSDTEATAWAWAMGKKIGLEENTIIEDEDYNGEGADLRLMLSAKAYYGINGLRAANMIKSIKDFPVLDKWLQDAQ